MLRNKKASITVALLLLAPAVLVAFNLVNASDFDVVSDRWDEIMEKEGGPGKSRIYEKIREEQRELEREMAELEEKRANSLEEEESVPGESQPADEVPAGEPAAEQSQENPAQNEPSPEQEEPAAEEAENEPTT